MNIDELHELHNDYPLAPEKTEIIQNMLAKHCSYIANKYAIKIGGVNKLIPNLGNKSKYVLHNKNIYLHMSLGMKLSKFHGILKLKQSGWWKRHIDFYTVKRKNSANSFEKDFFKLMNNSEYSRTKNGN